MFKQLAIAICLAALSPSASAQKIFADGKEIAGLDYVEVVRHITVPDGGTVGTIRYCYTPPGDTMCKKCYKAGKSLTLLNQYMEESYEKTVLKDASGAQLYVKGDLELFNMMSRIGYDYFRESGSVETTTYLFVRRGR
jgi:hypothetical protein